jgi:hypothetical protein
MGTSAALQRRFEAIAADAATAPIGASNRFPARKRTRLRTFQGLTETEFGETAAIQVDGNFLVETQNVDMV